MAKKYDAKIMLFSSSVVYGPQREGNKKMLETDVGIVDMLSERSSYDEGKRFSETMVKNYRDYYMIDAKIARIFRTYGPRMKLNDGQMIPDLIYSALDNDDLVIHGDENFSTSLCYISDIVDGVVKMMESDVAGPVNFGSDIGINITEVSKKIIEIIGSKSKIVYSDELMFLSPLCIPDISKARLDIGWIPVITLEHGIEKTIEDLRATKGLKSIRGTI
jgi:nucleoside-diphosphate-sugar epimerase